ncbi:MAG: hypothetical protein LBK91_03490, partial [Synergistaceae bacterium]|nr:hypothetical protein [Synergistaceae bacterium]
MSANPAEALSKKSEKKRGRPPGIKTCRAFGSSRWWTEGLVNYLTDVAPPSGIKAAKSYARTGRVMELNILPGIICAKVHGKRKAPYLVRIKLHTPDDDQLRNIRNALREKAIYRAMLLSGEIPPELGGIFSTAGVLQQMCTCSEPEETCKHVLAVLYVAAAAFDRDPFMLLRLKGLEKKALMELLCAPVGWEGTYCSSGPAIKDENPCLGGEPPGSMEHETAPPALSASFYGSGELPGESSRA